MLFLYYGIRQIRHPKKKKLLLEALEKTLGNIKASCKAAGIHRSTYYEWMDKDPDLANAVKHIGDDAIDHVESKLHELIDGVEGESSDRNGELVTYSIPPNSTAIIFYPENKGQITWVC